MKMTSPPSAEGPPGKYRSAPGCRRRQSRLPMGRGITFLYAASLYLVLDYAYKVDRSAGKCLYGPWLIVPWMQSFWQNSPELANTGVVPGWFSPNTPCLPSSKTDWAMLSPFQSNALCLATSGPISPALATVWKQQPNGSPTTAMVAMMLENRHRYANYKLANEPILAMAMDHSNWESSSSGVVA